MKNFILLFLAFFSLALTGQSIDDDFIYTQDCDQEQIIYSNQDFFFDFAVNSTVSPQNNEGSFKRDVTFFFINPVTGELLNFFNVNSYIGDIDFQIPQDILDGFPDGPVVMEVGIRYEQVGATSSLGVNLDVFDNGDLFWHDYQVGNNFISSTAITEVLCFTYVNCGELNVSLQKDGVSANVSGSNGPFSYTWYVELESGQTNTYHTQTIPQFPGCFDYILLVENTANGCSYYDEGTICQPDEPCLIGAIGNTSIKIADGGYSLSWGPVPGAASFIVTIYEGDPSCCKNSEFVAINTYTTTNRWIDFQTHSPGSDCFSYSISAVCPNGYVNPPVKQCYSTFLKGDDDVYLRSKSNATSMNLFPNPAVDRIQIQIDAVQQENVVLSIMDLTGKVIDRKNLQTIDNTINYTMDCTAVQDGVYLVQIQLNDKVLVEKVVITK